MQTFYKIYPKTKFFMEAVALYAHDLDPDLGARIMEVANSIAPGAIDSSQEEASLIAENVCTYLIHKARGIGNPPYPPILRSAELPEPWF